MWALVEFEASFIHSIMHANLHYGEHKFEGVFFSVLFNTIWCHNFSICPHDLSWSSETEQGYVIVELSHNFFGCVHKMFNWCCSFCRQAEQNKISVCYHSCMVVSREPFFSERSFPISNRIWIAFCLVMEYLDSHDYTKQWFETFSQACCFIYVQEGVQKPAKRVLPSPSPHTQPNKSPRPGEYWELSTTENCIFCIVMHW